MGLRDRLQAALTGTPRPVPLGGGPVPWEVNGLPGGLLREDIAAAALALMGYRPTGRVRPPGGSEQTPLTSSFLYGTQYPHNQARLRALRPVQVIECPRLGRGYPALFLPDPSRSDDVAPLAVVGPTGYVGSVWSQAGTRMRRAVDTALADGWVFATLLEVDRDEARAWLPTWSSWQRHPQ